MAAGLDRGYQTDLWHHLARGREIVGSGQIVNKDLFTFTIAGQDIRDANWLTQVVYYRLFLWGGLPLVQSTNAAVLALALVVIVRLSKMASNSIQAAAIVGVGTFFGLWPLILIRPQTLSFLLFALMYWALLRMRENKGMLALPPDPHGPLGKRSRRLRHWIALDRGLCDGEDDPAAG